MTTRTLSAATQTEIAKPDNILGWLAEIAFPSFTGRYSSYSDITWNALLFVGSSIRASNFDTDQSQGQIDLFDPDGALRTLCLTGSGVRNQPVKVWKFYYNAVAASDPILIFKGVGDEVNIEKGAVTISCVRANSDVLYAPRKRLGPATGCNFLASPGTIVPWGATTLLLNPSR